MRMQTIAPTWPPDVFVLGGLGDLGVGILSGDLAGLGFSGFRVSVLGVAALEGSPDSLATSRFRGY